jgi:hypothetical protein
MEEKSLFPCLKALFLLVVSVVQIAAVSALIQQRATPQIGSFEN